MILSSKRKFIFLRVPKTASTSLTHQIAERLGDDIDCHSGLHFSKFVKNKEELRMYSNLQVKMIGVPIQDSMYPKAVHFTLEDLVKYKIIFPSELKNYKVYGVIRNPIDWFLSHVGMTFPIEMKNLPVNEKVNSLLDIKEQFYPPQSKWLKFRGNLISDIVLYPHFDKLLFELTNDSTLRYNHRSDFRNHSEQITDESLIQRLENAYKEDFEIYDEVSKNYNAKN